MLVAFSAVFLIVLIMLHGILVATLSSVSKEVGHSFRAFSELCSNRKYVFVVCYFIKKFLANDLAKILYVVSEKCLLEIAIKASCYLLQIRREEFFNQENQRKVCQLAKNCFLRWFAWKFPHCHNTIISINDEKI